MMMIDNKYEIGQIVYLKTDDDQRARIITCIRVFQNELLYQLSCGSQCSDHYEFEISTEKNLLNALS